MPTVVYDHGCLVSTVKNISGAEMFFGFLPPHGKRLADQEEINVYGDVKEAVIRSTDRFGSRFSNGLLDALDAGLLEIVSTPLSIAYDETLLNSKVMGIDNGALNLTDPCWLTSLSEIP